MGKYPNPSAVPFALSSPARTRRSYGLSRNFEQGTVLSVVLVDGLLCDGTILRLADECSIDVAEVPREYQASVIMPRKGSNT